MISILPHDEGRMKTENFNPETHLFIYAHLDDETILSFGTILKLATIGMNVNIFVLCGGGSVSRNLIQQDNRLVIFKNLEKLHSNIKVCYGEFNDLSLTKSISDSVISRYIDQIQPTYVYTHSTADLHFEHQLVASSVLIATRPFPTSTIKGVYQTLSLTGRMSFGSYGNYRANYFVDISQFELQKREYLKKYETVCELPIDSIDNRSVDSVLQLNKTDGHLVGINLAESYWITYLKS